MVHAIREQNVQVAAGVVGAPPMPEQVDYQLTVNARGRLADEEEFGEIILKTGSDGELTRLRDVARIELAAGRTTRSAPCWTTRRPSASASSSPRAPTRWQLSTAVRATMAELKQNFPEGVDYQIVYDPTINVRTASGRS